MPGPQAKRIHNASVHVGADYSTEELAWMLALHAKALELGRRAVTDLTPGEILAVAYRLGYRKVSEPCPVSR